MSWWQRLFGRENAREETTAAAGQDPASLLKQVAFRITESTVGPPRGAVREGQKQWLPRLKRGRENAVKFRRDFLADKPFLRDPVDRPVSNCYSLGIVFDWEKMESNYGRQVFEAFFHQLQPSDFGQQVVVHFGDLIRFDAFCALVARGPNASDLAAIASGFGPNVKAPGLLPHGVRFLTADEKDAHLIARSFSLPISATIQGGRILPDSQAGVNWMIEPAIKGTSWRM